MTLTKADIKTALHKNLDIPRSETAKILESLLGIMKTTLANGEDILISGFGKFCIKDKKERRGRNPQTGDDLMLEPRKVIVFKWSEVLRDRINGIK
jgi:integration host factor subunit alpha